MIMNLDHFSKKPLRISENPQDLNDDNFLLTVSQKIISTINENSSTKLQEMAHKHFETPGKLLRPLFVKELAKSLGLDLNKALPWAVSCELLHNAALIHDDLQDGDEYRRGMPTIWRLYGREQAINVGDFLLTIAPQPLLLSSSGIKNELLFLFSKMSAQIVGGQVDEFELYSSEHRHDLLNKYLHCIGGKTSMLFSGLALGVVLMSGQPQKNYIALEEIFYELGLIFQIQDDILDLFGDKMRGQMGCDIQEGKITYLVAKHIENHPEDLNFLFRILRKRREQTSLEDVQKVKDLFVNKKTLDAAVADLRSRSHHLVSHDFLSQNIKFQNLTKHFVNKVLQPISHLQPE